MKNNIPWQDYAILIFGAIIMIGFIIHINNYEDPRSCDITGISFGDEHCLDNTVYARPDPPLVETYQQPKLIRTFRVGDDVSPHIHIVYEVVIDDEVLRYVQVIEPSD